MVETYELVTVQGPEIEYDRAEHLPPDEVSEALALEALHAVKFVRYANHDSTMPVRVLVPGCGPGTLAHGLLAHLNRDTDPYAQAPVHIDAFDSNKSAVAMAKSNVAKFTGKVDFTSNVFPGDWADQALWDHLVANPYDLVLFNPPYLPSSEIGNIRTGYDQTPVAALDGGIDGLDHYRAVVPQLPIVMKNRSTSEALFRYRTPAYMQTQLIGGMIIGILKGKCHFGLRMFPSEGPVMRSRNAIGDQRWISFGVLCLNPLLESSYACNGLTQRRKLDSCMGITRQMIGDASRAISTD